MPSKEITELRKAGKLEEALKMAKEELFAKPDNIWCKRSISWIYYEYSKIYSEHNGAFLKCLQKISDLDLPENETMLFDSLTWQIGKNIYAAIKKDDKSDFNSHCSKVLDFCKDFHFTKPSPGYTFLLKAFHKSKTVELNGFNENIVQDFHYSELIDWWDITNLMPEDYLPSEYNGRTIISLAEQIAVKYSKVLLVPNNILGRKYTNIEKSTNKDYDVERIENWITFLDLLIHSKERYQYPLFYKGKLLLVLNKVKEARKFITSFVKKKQNEFWPWELLGDSYEQYSDERFSCLCKALTLKTPPQFTLNIRMDIAKLLISRKLFEEAKFEIDEVIKVRKENDWKLNEDLNHLITKEWYQNSVSKTSNTSLYSNYSILAEELLFDDINEVYIAVEFVNNNKNFIHFVSNNDTRGFFKYNSSLKNMKVGSILKVRIVPQGSDGLFVLKTSKLVNLENNNHAIPFIKNDSGTLTIRTGNTFGFIENIFVPSQVITSSKSKDGDNIQFSALRSYNKKKDEWGWKCYEIWK